MRRLSWMILALAPLATAGGPSRAEPQKDKAVEEELQKFEGTWKFASLEVGGKQVAVDTLKGSRLVLKGSQFTMIEGPRVTKGTFQVDVHRKPKQLDITFLEGPQKGEELHGIYELNGDTYKLCFAMGGKDRPTEFATKPGSGHVLEVLRREKPGAR
jgi:uncharacterized protein (TIGR03067 family)